MFDTSIKIILGICLTPVLAFLIVKYGTLGFYMAKKYIEENKNNHG